MQQVGFFTLQINSSDDVLAGGRIKSQAKALQVV